MKKKLFLEAHLSLEEIHTAGESRDCPCRPQGLTP